MRPVAHKPLPIRPRFPTLSRSPNPLRLTLLAAPIVLAAALPFEAQAHAILVDSTPEPLGHVAAGHIGVVFRYNSRIDSGRSRLALVSPDGTTKRLETVADPAPDLLRADLDLQPGEYTLTWQVLAVDGHITRGRVPFTVDGAKQVSTEAPAGKSAAGTH